MSKWHLLSYDISGKQRLRRVHYIAAKECVAIQQSVFLYYGSSRKLADLLAKLDAVVVPDDDDVRVYPVSHPAHLWLGGRFRGEDQQAGPTAAPGWRARLQGWWRRLRDRHDDAEVA
jgi:CRISPR-associated endonuclease Cas2